MSNQLTDDLISLIFNTGQILREKVSEKIGFKDCSFLHAQTLHFIKDKDKTTMKDVAGYLRITPPSATSLINSLVEKGLLIRTSDKDDRRTIKLEITKEGTELMKNNFKRVTGIIEKSISRLSEKEKKGFINILNKISE
jgi:MarR family transcriptional regulator, lower aerobic nicotinate degradation pathway regulator